LLTFARITQDIVWPDYAESVEILLTQRRSLRALKEIEQLKKLAASEQEIKIGDVGNESVSNRLAPRFKVFRSDHKKYTTKKALRALNQTEKARSVVPRNTFFHEKTGGLVVFCGTNSDISGIK